jgi:hypothetical protein
MKRPLLPATRHVPGHWRLEILNEHNYRKASALFAEFTGERLQHRAVREMFEKLVEQAIGADEGHIEVSIGLAEAVAILIKAAPVHGAPRLSRNKRTRKHLIFEMAKKDRKDRGLSEEETISEIKKNPFQRRRAETREIKGPVFKPTAQPVLLNFEDKKPGPVSLKEALGKDYTIKHIKDQLQRRKPRTGK